MTIDFQMRLYPLIIAFIFLSACNPVDDESKIFQTSSSTVPDTGWHFSEDSVRESILIVLYSDWMGVGSGRYKRGDMEKALNGFQKSEMFLDSLIRHNPVLNRSLYINGKMIYRSLIELSGDRKTKDFYRTKLKELVEMEAKYYPIVRSSDQSFTQ
jgi:hypothetical protein